MKALGEYTKCKYMNNPVGQDAPPGHSDALAGAAATHGAAHQGLLG